MRTATCGWTTETPENDCQIGSIGAIFHALASIRLVPVADRRRKNVFFAEGLDHPARHGSLSLSLQDQSRPLGAATSHASPSESPWQATHIRRFSGPRFPSEENSLAHTNLWAVLWVAWLKVLYFSFFLNTYTGMMAERAGFEPALGYYPKHAFQACDLNHSSISPEDREF